MTEGSAMPQLETTATFSGREADDDALTTIVARSVLEAALREDVEAELWFDVQRGDESVRLTVDLSTTDLEEMLRLAGSDDILLALDGEAVEGLFGDPDVEGHGLKGALAIAVSSAAILAPEGRAALPQTAQPLATVRGANPAATAQVSAAATMQVSSVAAARSQIAKAQVSKAQAGKARGIRLLGSGLAH
jgi:hypothetical protein